MSVVQTTESSELKLRINGTERRTGKSDVSVVTSPATSTQSRVNVAATRNNIDKTTNDRHGYRNRRKTVLEQHCMFFDKDNDGVIWPVDTWRTCRGFGWGFGLTLFFTCFLHLVQSWGTVPWFWLIPDPLFRVWIHNIHNNKHGSSTLIFDNWGSFRGQLFDEFFERNDADGKGGVSFHEGLAGLRRLKNPWDIFGQISVLFEWGMTYMLLWPEDGVVRKEDAKGVIDGSIFHTITAKTSAKNGNKYDVMFGPDGFKT